MRLEHPWPPGWNESLDTAIVRGIVEAIVRGCPALRRGCVVTRSVAIFDGQTTPRGSSIAASMAMQDAARRAGWNSVPPPDDAIATFGRLAG